MNVLETFCEKRSPVPIPNDLREVLAPATHYVEEWCDDYWLKCPGATHLRIGSVELMPEVDRWFHLRFENQLGLAKLEALDGRRLVHPPLYIEVISNKFPTPDRHVAFLRGLLDDLFERAARLPFAISAPTGRGVAESLRPPTPLFTLHFLCQHRGTLQTALALIQNCPHRQLRDHADFIPLIEATEADADVLIGILHAPHEWTRAEGFTLAERLGGYAPVRVWQRRPEETFDTPENRFTLAFLREVLNAADALPSHRWWNSVPPERQRIVREAANLVRQAIVHPMFDSVGALEHFPSASQVLLRRDGYRELLTLWQIFRHSRRPLFEPLRQAMDVRDVATLYETWTFFALVEDIAVLLEQSPKIDLRLSDESGLGWQAEARFGTGSKLVYNQYQPSYSVPLRPDFTWVRDGRPDIVLDAKFRLERQSLESTRDEDTPQATARRTDLYKMHTYRDALGVRAAVAIYPGDVSVFYDHTRGRHTTSLGDLLMGDGAGIGAIALNPVEPFKEHQPWTPKS